MWVIWGGGRGRLRPRGRVVKERGIVIVVEDGFAGLVVVEVVADDDEVEVVALVGRTDDVVSASDELSSLNACWSSFFLDPNPNSPLSYYVMAAEIQSIATGLRT